MNSQMKMYRGQEPEDPECKNCPPPIEELQCTTLQHVDAFTNPKLIDFLCSRVSVDL